MNIEKKYIKVFILIVFFSLTLAGCSSQQILEQKLNHPLQQDSNMKIAIIKPSQSILLQENSSLLEYLKLGITINGFKNLDTNVYEVADAPSTVQAFQKITANHIKLVVALDLPPSIAKTVIHEVKLHNLILFTLANNPNLADGDNIFVFGHTPSKQAERLIDYFNKEYMHYIFLLPYNKNYRNISHILQEKLVTNEAVILRTEFYQDNLASIQSALQNINITINNLPRLKVNPNKVILYIASDRVKSTQQIYDGLKMLGIDNQLVIAGDCQMDIEYPKGINIYLTGYPFSKHKIFSNEYLSYVDVMAYDLGSIIARSIGKNDNFSRDNFIYNLNNETHYGLAGKIYLKEGVATREYSIVKRAGNEYTLFDQNK